jgi:hypothetical protein
MGVDVSVVLEGFDGTVKPQLPAGGKDLARHNAALDAAARRARVKRLWSFAHSLEEELEWADRALGSPDQERITADEATRYLEERDKQQVRAGKWYAAADGLRTVDGILSYLSKHPELGCDACAADLNAIKKVLEKAKQQRRRFRLSVS